MYRFTLSHICFINLLYKMEKKNLTSVVPYVDETVMHCVNCLQNTKCIYTFVLTVYIFAFYILFTILLNSIGHSISNCNFIGTVSIVKVYKLIFLVIILKQLILISLTWDNLAMLLNIVLMAGHFSQARDLHLEDTLAFISIKMKALTSSNNKFMTHFSHALNVRLIKLNNWWKFYWFLWTSVLYQYFTRFTHLPHLCGFSADTLYR